MNGPALEYKLLVDEAYTTFLDSVYGFYAQVKELEQYQNGVLENLKCTDPLNANMSFLDSQEINYTIDGERVSRGKISIYKTLNSPDGKNWQWAARMFVVTIYELWESEYRSSVADKIGIKRDELKVPIFGDLRHIRNWIIHNKSVADSKASELQIISWFAESDAVTFSYYRVFELVDLVRKELSKIIG